MPGGREPAIAFGCQVRTDRAQPRIGFGIGGHGREGIGIDADTDCAVCSQLHVRTADSGLHHFRLTAIEEQGCRAHFFCKAGCFGHAFAGAQGWVFRYKLVFQREGKPQRFVRRGGERGAKAGLGQ